MKNSLQLKIYQQMLQVKAGETWRLRRCQDNGLADKVTIIRGKVEEISLPEGVDKAGLLKC